jgi:hypothetical protein
VISALFSLRPSHKPQTLSPGPTYQEKDSDLQPKADAEEHRMPLSIILLQVQSVLQLDVASTPKNIISLAHQQELNKPPLERI